MPTYLPLLLVDSYRKQTIIFLDLGALTHFSWGFDSLGKTNEDEDPGEQETENQMPA